MKTTLVFSILLVLPLCAVSAVAEPPQPELGKWWKNSEVVRELQLSQRQVDRIERIFLDFRSELARLNNELKEREERLKALMNRELLDDSKIRSQTELIAQSRAALEKANSSMALAIRKELSREQWNRLEGIRELRLGSRIVPRNSSQGLAEEAHPGQYDEKVYAVGPGVKAPVVLYQPMPSYTDEARAARVEGIVLLQAIIRENGRATDVKVRRGVGCGLDEKAVDIVAREWRFAPGTVDGKPVNVQATIEISFRLY